MANGWPMSSPRSRPSTPTLGGETCTSQPVAHRGDHRYFDTSHAILAATVTNDLDALRAAAARLCERAKDDTA